jgi:hypothetical protein
MGDSADEEIAAEALGRVRPVLTLPEFDKGWPRKLGEPGDVLFERWDRQGRLHDRALFR